VLVRHRPGNGAPQLVYASLAIGIVVVSDGIERRKTDRSIGKSAVEHLRADFAVPLAMLLVLLVGLAVSGQLRGFLTLYGRGNDSVAYSTWPTGFPELDVVGFPRALVVIACSAILIAIGTYELLAEGTRRRYGQALAGVGMVILMVLQKHFMRWMDDQLFLMAVMCRLIVGIGWPGRRRMGDYIVAGIILGAIIAMLAAKPETPSMLAAVADAPSRLLRDLDVVGDGPRAWQAVNMARFARDRVVCTLPSASWSIDSRCY